MWFTKQKPQVLSNLVQLKGLVNTVWTSVYTWLRTTGVKILFTAKLFIYNPKLVYFRLGFNWLTILILGCSVIWYRAREHIAFHLKEGVVSKLIYDHQRVFFITFIIILLVVNALSKSRFLNCITAYLISVHQLFFIYLLSISDWVDILYQNKVYWIQKLYNHGEKLKYVRECVNEIKGQIAPLGQPFVEMNDRTIDYFITYNKTLRDLKTNLYMAYCRVFENWHNKKPEYLTDFVNAVIEVLKKILETLQNTPRIWEADPAVISSAYFFSWVFCAGIFVLGFIVWYLVTPARFTPYEELKKYRKVLDPRKTVPIIANISVDYAYEWIIFFCDIHKLNTVDFYAAVHVLYPETKKFPSRTSAQFLYIKGKTPAGFKYLVKKIAIYRLKYDYTFQK